MSRRKSTAVLPQLATSMLRRSARLVSLQNRIGQVKPGKDLVLGSEPPRKSRRKLLPEVSKSLAYSLDSSIGGSSSKKSPESNSSLNGFSSPRRSLRISSRRIFDTHKEKPPRCSSTKPASTSSSRMKSSSNVSCPCTLRRSSRFSSGGRSVEQSSLRKSGNSVLSRCSTKSISSERAKGRNGVRSRDRSRSRICPKTKQMFRGSDDDDDDDDDDEEAEVSVCISEGKRKRIAKPNEEEISVPKAYEEKRIEREVEEEVEEEEERKNKLEKGWTDELELALQGAYLTVKPSPNFWKKVSKLVPGKSAQECFDKVNSDLITPRQPLPRSRARKTNLSPIPQFSLSASKLLKPNSPKTKIRKRRNNLSKKAMRHLLEKQNHMDKGLGFDLFSVFEPGTTSNFLSTPMEKRESLSKIRESPMFGSGSSSKYQPTLISPPVLKQVKNKALHEKYLDHLHIREAKRKAKSTQLSRKENIRPIDDNQRKDSVRAVKDALFFDVKDAIQKLKGLEAENSSDSSEFCFDRGETDEEDYSI